METDYCIIFSKNNAGDYEHMSNIRLAAYEQYQFDTPCLQSKYSTTFIILAKYSLVYKMQIIAELCINFALCQDKSNVSLMHPTFCKNAHIIMK